MTRLYIAWKSECFRSAQTADMLDCGLHLISPVRGKGKLGALWRYALSSVETIGLLLTRRPNLIAIINQPFPLVVICVGYAKLFGARLVLDCHSKVYDSDFPALFRPFYRHATQFAAVNINHNEKDRAIVESWSGRSMVVETILADLPEGLRPEVDIKGDGSVFCVCTFAADEPISLILDAARSLPGVRFKVTGNTAKYKGDIAQAPPNVTFLGFVPTRAYYAEMGRSSAVMTLSTRPWIIQMAMEEAVLLGKPVVTNHSPVMQGLLGGAGSFVDLTVESLRAGVERAISDNARLHEMTISARTRQRQAVRQKLTRINAYIAG